MAWLTPWPGNRTLLRSLAPYGLAITYGQALHGMVWAVAMVGSMAWFGPWPWLGPWHGWGSDHGHGWGRTLDRPLEGLGGPCNGAISSGCREGRRAL